MPNQYRVTQVHETNEWTSSYGPMLSHELSVENLTDGTSGFVQINSKPGKAYNVGETFWADTAGEYRGVLKLKRFQPPKDGFGASNGRQPAQPPRQPQNAPVVVPESAPAASPKREAMPYADALRLMEVLTKDTGSAEQGGRLFEAIIAGLVVSPLKPKATVKYFGNVLETAGIEQAQWDEIDGLVKQLVRETDEKHVKALLVATCQVESRKDLTPDKATLFANTIKAELKVIEAQKVPPDTEDIQF